MKQNSTRRGFTLIELLVVVIIIAILAAIALPQYNKAVIKARAAEIQTFIAHLEKAMDLYVLENGYPSSGDRYIPWDEMGIDVSSYCDSVGEAPYYTCTAKNFSVNVPYMGLDAWTLHINPSPSAFGGGWSTVQINASRDGTKIKECNLSSLKAKPLCDALKANDSSWEIGLPS